MASAESDAMHTLICGGNCCMCNKYNSYLSIYIFHFAFFWFPSPCRTDKFNVSVEICNSWANRAQRVCGDKIRLLKSSLHDTMVQHLTLLIYSIYIR